MMSSENKIDHWQTVLAAVLMSAASAAIFLLLPMLIGSMVDSLGLTEEQAGNTVAVYFGSYTLVCLSGYFWIRKVNWQLLAGGGYLLLILGLLFSDRLGVDWLWASLLVAGIGAGVLLGLGVTLISDMRNPDRTFGWQMLTQQTFPACLLFALPVVLPANAGFSELTLSIAIPLAVLACTVVWVPVSGVKTNAVQQVIFDWRKDWPVIAILISVIVYFAALSGVWAFVERFAAARELSSNVVGRALAIALVGGAFGGVAAAMIAGRFSRGHVLLACSIAFLVVFGIYDTHFDLLLFTLASILFSFVWNICMAFQQGFVAALDVSGRFMVLVPSAIASGAVLGPVIAGGLIDGEGYSALLLAMGVILAVSTIPFLVFTAGRHARGVITSLDLLVSVEIHK